MPARSRMVGAARREGGSVTRMSQEWSRRRPQALAQAVSKFSNLVDGISILNRILLIGLLSKRGAEQY